MLRKALIVKVKRDDNGNIADIMLDNGKIYSIDEAISMSKDGLIENIIIEQGRNGVEYFRDNPTNHGNDSFDHLPEF